MTPHIVVVESDVPEGMTLREWRLSRMTPAPERPPVVRLMRRMRRGASAWLY